MFIFFYSIFFRLLSNSYFANVAKWTVPPMVLMVAFLGASVIRASAPKLPSS